MAAKRRLLRASSGEGVACTPPNRRRSGAKLQNQPRFNRAWDKMDDNCAIRQGVGGCVLRACMHSAKTTSVEGAEHASPHSLNGCPHPPSNCPPFFPPTFQCARTHRPIPIPVSSFPHTSATVRRAIVEADTSTPQCRWIGRGERKAGLTVRRLCRRRNTSHSKRSACKTKSAPQTNNNLPLQSKRSTYPPRPSTTPQLAGSSTELSPSHERLLGTFFSASSTVLS
jgi:hypothetical protein